jgi:dienelactone hydrolase
MFPGAGHGFLRAQSAVPANLEATQKAWPMTIAFFREHLESK